MPQKYTFIYFIDTKHTKKCPRNIIFMLSWTYFEYKSVHENVFLAFRGHFFTKLKIVL